MHRPARGMISIMFGMPSPLASRDDDNRDEDQLNREDEEDASAEDCDAHFVTSVLRSMQQRGSVGVRAVRVLSKSLARMADAHEQRDQDELEDAAENACSALGDLHVTEGE